MSWLDEVTVCISHFYSNPLHVIEEPEPSQEAVRSCIRVQGVSILPLLYVLRFDYGIDATV
jgi:hypothetical protein